ncbi:MAG TPA: signal peptidase I [Vicinamibacterales bacterium]|nr:signal peptidase I [Vicinamibacterales bacterium]
MVQQELHPQDERLEGDRNTGQPVTNTPPSGLPEAVAPHAGTPEESSPSPFEANTVHALTPAYAERADHTPEFATSDGRYSRVEPILEIAPAASPDVLRRIDVDDQSSAVVRRLELWRDEFIAWIKTLASAAVYATLIVTFGFQVARVEGQSMAPTLADQDRLIVNKLAYRLADPQRGDIVMLYYPLNPDKSFVKRVIAEEGDTVRIVDGRVYVNDVPLRDDYVPPEYRSHDDWGPQVIPEGYYFVMGDHRNNSSDSRHWGFVPKKYIIGKVQLRWWPVPHGRVF